MLFALKKFVSYWLMPLPFSLVVVAVGVWIAWRRQHPRLGLAIATAGLLLLLTLSNPLVSRALLRPLEAQFPAIPESTLVQPLPAPLFACRYIVVLGGGNGYSPETSAINLLSNSALARLTEAIRLLRLLPAAHLVVSGPESGNRTTHATVLARAAMSLGVPAERILQIDHARDTEEEAQAVAHLAGGAPVALVTSAWHLPRAVALFRGAGIDVIPCPADFRTHTPDRLRWNDLVWDLSALERSSLAVRERLGLAWARLRGKAR